MPLDEMLARRPRGIILSGGPASVHVDHAPSIDAALYDAGVPLLGICYGAQLVAQQLGGEVRHTGGGEYGATQLRLTGDASALFGALSDEQVVWMSHGDAITNAPDGFRVTAASPGAAVAALEDRDRGVYGVQFHPEVAHTERGQEVLKAFLYDVCGCRPSWTNTSIIEQAVNEVRAQVGGERVLCGLSGGVDSAVAAALVHKAIGDQLTCVFVDTGLMREGEAEQVTETFRGQFHVDLIHVKAADRFLAALNDIADPERKRKIIGETFIRVFEEVARDVEDARFLVQGTLYPDIVESGGSESATIKSHHNVGGLPDDMQFELVEPLRNLFKDEVRAVGEELGLPEEIVWRQPFPGPGLAVRVVGTITTERLEVLRRADAVVVEEIKRAGLYGELWQSFAVLPVVRTVGVMGDGRTYEYPIVVRAVTSDDASTGTRERRFDKSGVEPPEESRRAYRDLLFTTDGVEEFISGVILFDETIRQSTSDGVPFAKVLADKGIIPGIKVDKGAKPLALAAEGETVTEGLDGLRERLAEYRELGARFAKLRATYTITDQLPSGYTIDVNADALARYAALCQEAGLVPIVEPEVLMDGTHTIDRASDVTAAVLEAVFHSLYAQRCAYEGLLLKPNMVLPGYDSPKQVSDEEIAEASVRCYRWVVPAAVPGIVFLSGGQSDEQATARLYAMNRIGPHPWELSFSYGRALQAAAQQAWKGDAANRDDAQRAFYHRAKMNGVARSGKYSPDMERAA